MNTTFRQDYDFVIFTPGISFSLYNTSCCLLQGIPDRMEQNNCISWLMMVQLCCFKTVITSFIRV